MIDSASRNIYYVQDIKALPENNQEKNQGKPEYIEIVKRIQKALGAKNQRQIARILHISDSSVSEWKKTGYISKENLNLISGKALTKVTIEWILTGKEEGGKNYEVRLAENTKLAKIEKLLREKSLPEVFLQLLEKIESLESRLSVLEPTKDNIVQPNDDAPSGTVRENSILSIAEKPTNEQWKELCALSGENIPIDAMVAYVEYHKRGNKRFLTHYTKRIQDLITAYKENRLEDYLSEQAPDEGKEAG